MTKADKTSNEVIIRGCNLPILKFPSFQKKTKEVPMPTVKTGPGSGW